jgi:NADH-quinone oxidoreductase subunit L
VVTAPLLLLAIPSVVIGFMTIQPMLYGEFFKDSILVNVAAHPAMKELAHEFHGAVAMATHAFGTLPFWLAAAGVATAYVFYMVAPGIPAAIGRALAPLVTVMENKYYMDWINEHILAAGARLLGRSLWKGGDVALIDGFAINGSAKVVGWVASLVRLFQTGYIYHYALVMLLGVFALMTWFVWLAR